MDYTILIGTIISAINVLILIITTKFVGGRNLGYPYRTTNKLLATVGWIALILGLAIVILKAKTNGQLG